MTFFCAGTGTIGPNNGVNTISFWVGVTMIRLSVGSIFERHSVADVIEKHPVNGRAYVRDNWFGAQTVAEWGETVLFSTLMKRWIRSRGCVVLVISGISFCESLSAFLFIATYSVKTLSEKMLRLYWMSASWAKQIDADDGMDFPI